MTAQTVDYEHIVLANSCLFSFVYFIHSAMNLNALLNFRISVIVFAKNLFLKWFRVNITKRKNVLFPMINDSNAFCFENASPSQIFAKVRITFVLFSLKDLLFTLTKLFGIPLKTSMQIVLHFFTIVSKTLCYF